MAAGWRRPEARATVEFLDDQVRVAVVGLGLRVDEDRGRARRSGRDWPTRRRSGWARGPRRRARRRAPAGRGGSPRSRWRRRRRSASRRTPRTPPRSGSTNGPTDETKLDVEALGEIGGRVAADQRLGERDPRPRRHGSELDTVHVVPVRLGPQPGDRRGEAVLQARARLPAEQSRGRASGPTAGRGPRSPSGRTRAGSSTTVAVDAEQRAGHREQLADRLAAAGPELDRRALDAGAPSAARTKPSTVSATNVRSRRGSRRPSGSRAARRAAGGASSAGPRAPTGAARTC